MLGPFHFPDDYWCEHGGECIGEEEPCTPLPMWVLETCLDHQFSWAQSLIAVM
jgi:hypothetical protein